VPPHALLVHAAALLLAVAGIQKLADPHSIEQALQASGLPSGAGTGRLLGAVELGVASWVLVWAGAAPAGALAAVYAGFLAFITANRLRGLDVPCGCLGESDRPPGLPHVLIDVVAVAAGLAGVVAPVGDVTGWLDDGASGALVLVAIVAVAALGVVVLMPPRSGRR
jgi:hypothetical protein